MIARSRSRTRPLSLAEFHALPEDAPHLELIDGEVYRKPVGKEPHSRAQWNLTLLLGTHAQTKAGRGYTEVGYDFPGPLRDNHRVPDLSFYRPGRARQGEPYPTEMPDVAVEIRSQGQTMDLLRGRLAFLRDRGVPCTLLIDPRAQSVEVYDAGRTYLARGDDEVTLDTLDGFSFALPALFAY